MAELLESVGRVGQILRGTGDSQRKIKGARDAEGRKIRPPPEFLTKLGLKSEPDSAYKKHVAGFAYTSEDIFTIFASLVLIELFVKNPQVLIGVHSARVVGMLAVSIFTAYNMYRGYAYPELDLRFYSVELLILLAINIASLVISSVRVSKKRQQGQPITTGDMVAIGFASGLILMNGAFIMQQVYRHRLGKRETPVNSFFTLLMAVFLAFVSGRAIQNNFVLLQ